MPEQLFPIIHLQIQNDQPPLIQPAHRQQESPIFHNEIILQTLKLALRTAPNLPHHRRPLRPIISEPNVSLPLA